MVSYSLMTTYLDSIERPLINHKINNFKPLLQRVEKDKVDAMVEASKQDSSTGCDKSALRGATGRSAPSLKKLASMISSKLIFRVARIVKG
jgi:methionyl-tRNA synthetase